MACCTGSSSEEDSGSSASAIIDKQLKQDEKKVHSQVKLLLLGWSPLISFFRDGTDPDRCGRKWQVDDTQGNESVALPRMQLTSLANAGDLHYRSPRSRRVFECGAANLEDCHIF
jgi:hypothetical protein